MDEAQLLAMLDNVVSSALLLLVWQLERKRSERLETKNDSLMDIFIDDHKAMFHGKNATIFTPINRNDG